MVAVHADWRAREQHLLLYLVRPSAPIHLLIFRPAKQIDCAAGFIILFPSSLLYCRL